MAKASGEGRASPLVLSGTSAGVNVGVAGAGGVNPYEPWEMTPREREVASKYLKVECSFSTPTKTSQYSQVSTKSTVNVVKNHPNPSQYALFLRYY